MQNDPRYPFMVGRLVGAAEQAAIMLQAGKLAAEELKELGFKLDEIAAWFIEGKSAVQVAKETAPRPTRT
jgi:hypothetical protein